MPRPIIEQNAQKLADSRPALELSALRKVERVQLLSYDDSNPAFRRIVLQHDTPEFVSAFHTPGQYTTLTYGDLSPRFLVIASAPTETPSCWEFMLSRDSTLGRTISMDEPEPFWASAPEGNGFSQELWSNDDQPLLLFCSGSGFATMRTLLKHLEANASTKLQHTTLYMGLGQPKEKPYQALLDELQRNHGLAVHYAFDQSTSGPRFVQQAFEENPIGLTHAHVALSGAPIMIRETSKFLMNHGVPFDRLYLNL